MKIGDNLSFCIIKNPFSEGQHKFLVFFTRKGKLDIDDTIIKEEAYESIRYIMSNLGLDEVDILTFETNSNVIKNFDIGFINQKLQETGFTYSEDFEKSLLNDLKKALNETPVTDKPKDSKLVFTGRIATPDDGWSQSKKEQKDFSKSPVYKIPDIGQKITLYFYLFLECKLPKDGGVYVDINVDFDERKSSNMRSFLRIMKSEFIRIQSPNPNEIVLQSVKKYSDFLDECSILQRVLFKIAKPYQDSFGNLKIGTEDYSYNILDIRKILNPEEKIQMHVNVDYHYDYMTDMSKRIRREHILDSKKLIPKEFIKTELDKLKVKYTAKMEASAEDEEYEKASGFKRLVSFIDEKIKIANEFEGENMSQREFFKNFSLS